MLNSSTQPITVMHSGTHVLDAQLVVVGKVLLLRKDHCVVMLGTRQKIHLPLTFPATKDGVVYHVQVPVLQDTPAEKPTVTRTKVSAGGETKIGRCRALYDERHLSLTREEMTALFVKLIGCTPAGAVTYYLTCKKDYDKS